MSQWWRRLYPWHEHTYSIVGPLTIGPGVGHDARSKEFACRCGHKISGDDLFAPNSMMGRHWRERNG